MKNRFCSSTNLLISANLIHLLFLLVILFNPVLAQGQKKIIDQAVIKRWQSIDGDILVSKNGAYVAYQINNSPLGTRTLMIQSIKSSWRKSYVGNWQIFFTNDSKQAFLTNGDKAYNQQLGSDKIDSLLGITDLKKIESDSGELIVYKQNDKVEILIQKSSIKKEFENVFDYRFDNHANKLLIIRNIPGSQLQSLSLVDFPFDSEILIAKGVSLNDLTFDQRGEKLAFTTVDENKRRLLWLYQLAQSKLTLVTLNQKNISDDIVFEQVSSFNNRNDSLLFVQFGKQSELKSLKKSVSVDIWNYQDAKLQSQQLNEIEHRNYLCSVNIITGKVLQLQNNFENVQFIGNDNAKLLITAREADNSERYWNKKAIVQYFIVDPSTGKREHLNINGDFISFHAISPDQHYLLFYNLSKGDYLNYNLISKTWNNLTAKILFSKSAKDNSLPKENSRGLNWECWMENNFAIIYDQFDLWKINIDGHSNPINLTQGYGRKNKTQFRLLLNTTDKISGESNQLLLRAFDLKNKQSGFYSLNLLKSPTLKKLYMGDDKFGEQIYQAGASDAKVYFLTRANSGSSKNYYYSNDLTSFTAISNVHPEKECNWLTAQLINYRSLAGDACQGILYKPENFDPQKKYPLIFNYYEQKSDHLNEFLDPSLSFNEINIPWFVSRGYLVFTPDIYYSIGSTGESVLNSLLGAVQKLKAFHWIDPNHLGLQGHSFGAYETNYLITHSKIFTAAVSAAGISDLVSAYGAVSHGGRSKQSFFESEQYRIGQNLWQNRYLYIKGSPIFYADRVTTPVLLMNNKKDDAVPFSQGLEFFTALRRLGKRAWLLQYDGEAHSLSNEDSKLDYTKRITQFFDHYLKQEPCPRWMIYGVKADEKTQIDGLDLIKKRDKIGKWITPQTNMLR